jgi:hypothetical protein
MHKHNYSFRDVEFVIKGSLPKFNLEKEQPIDYDSYLIKKCTPERISSILLVSEVTEHYICSICLKNHKQVYSCKDNSLDYKILEKHGFSGSNDWSRYPFERSGVETIKKSVNFPANPDMSVLQDFQRFCSKKYGKDISESIIARNNFEHLTVQN